MMNQPTVFISYRRSDSATIAGRIYDRLVDAFGEANVFKDTYGISPGEDFRGIIKEHVARCDVVLVIIGPTWLTVQDAKTGQRRLDNPGDWVRLEVETGLQRDGAVVIPVLVDRADMPSADDLPDTLRELAYKNAALVRNDPDFRDDMRRLTAVIEKIGGVESSRDDNRQNRFLEAAMPACTRTSTATEVRVKISLPGSIGLRGELPDVLPSGDVIQKGDVRSTSFQMTFPVQQPGGSLLPGAVCVRVIADDFVVRSGSSGGTVCGESDVELSVPPDYDSRTVVFDLEPAAGAARLGLSRVRVEVYAAGSLVAETSVSTRLVNALSDDPACSFWWVSSTLPARQPAPAPVPPPVPSRRPPAAPRPQDMPLPHSSQPAKGVRGFLGSPLWQGIGVIVAIVALVVTVLLFIAQNNGQRTPTPAPTDTAAPAPSPSQSSETEAPARETSAPTNTAAPSPVPTLTPALPPTETGGASPQAAPITTSGLTIGGQAVVRGANETDTYLNIRAGVTRNHYVIQQVPVGATVTIVEGPVASEDRLWWKVRTPDGVEGWAIESSSSRQTLLPVERTATLRLILTPDSLTLVVAAAQAVNLSGLEFLVSDGRGGTHTEALTRGFDFLLLTNGMAEAGTCFVAVEAGTTPPLPAACTQPPRVYRRELPRADVFWYDFTANRQRDVAVMRDGSLVALCAASAAECTIDYN